MKKLILLAFVLVSGFASAQTFTFNPDGSSEYVVYNVEKATAKELYTKALNWISVTYQNPEVVTKAKVENEMIRIEALQRKVFTRIFTSGSIGDYDAYYILEIEFKDGKFRIKYTHTQTTIDSSKVFFPFEDVINNKTDTNGNRYDNCKAQYEANVQALMNSFYDYITKPKDKW